MNAHSPPTLRRSQQRLFASRLAGSALAVQLLILAASRPFDASAQSDTFDSYATQADFKAAGWILSSLDPSLVTTTFPPTGTGKGLRIQANPVPPQAPAVGMWYHTNEYADFYMAVDIANWPGTDKNQAAVMFARMTEASTGTVVSDQNPASAQGIICNYDTSQYGENPGDRRQGQFQINTVGAGFDANTLASADITFVPGRAYRLIFKGAAFHYTAQAFDYNDLTTPLVTIEADDASMASSKGACGILAYSRQGNTGIADLTFDNYYVGTNSPNPAPGSILAHPIAGTPAVDTRIPASRWKNFFNPATPISFTANTYSTNPINALATKFHLNGVDLSAKLSLSDNATNLSGSLPASVLSSNALYSAEIIVTDISGTRSSTNTFWFDTFSDAYLRSASVKTVEVEEYNYNGGVFQLDPIRVSGLDTNLLQVNGLGIGYYDLAGTAGIDYSNHNTTPDPNFNKFRTTDPVRTLNGGLLGVQDANHLTEYDPSSDNVRSQHGLSNLLEYVVANTEPGEWLDYTRKFDPAFYTVFLRYSSFGATTNELHLVTSDPAQPGQTTVKLGAFALANNMRFPDYLYAPLLDDSGATALVNLAGTNTLRLQIARTPGQDNRKAMLNYIMLVQTPVVVFSSASVSGPYSVEAEASINVATRTITIPINGASRFYRLGSATPLRTRVIQVSATTVTLTL